MSYPYAYSRTSNYYPVWRQFYTITTHDWYVRYMAEDMSKYCHNEAELLLYTRTIFWTC